MARYPFRTIEKKWQRFWEENKTFRTRDEIDSGKPKFYVLDMFPYPSGEGLHVGHPEGYTATDIIARYKRMNGFNVLHPMGWDAFGLPAEQYAIQTGTHPRETTAGNIVRFRSQLKSLGFSYDWVREVDTTDPVYFRWTQWIFLKLFEKGLAYMAEVPVNWCPELGTVLANEEIVDGKSERGGYPVFRRPMRQWMLRITAYAEQLLEDLETLDWPESTKILQRNWIGRSEGADIVFEVQGHPEKKITVFTTRPDTLFGATYMVLAPEHELVGEITTGPMREAVESYKSEAAGKSDLERTELQKAKTGVFTGAYAVNPATGEDIPIWIADYVLVSYGTGAIMAVPAHDSRDYEFAKTFHLPIREVISGGNIGKEAYVEESGILVNSSSSRFSIDGLEVKPAKTSIIGWLESEGLGRHRINYRLRDWLFSRQRYWGEPIPILHGPDGTVRALEEQELPVELPDMDDFKPHNSSDPLEEPTPPLSRAPESWRYVERDGICYERETNTMPQWAGSCWYYLRFIDPVNPVRLVDPEKEKYWMPVDLYVGGAEHSVLHLLYARFWHKVLFDLGVVSTPEPFGKLIHQGMILGELEFRLYENEAGEPVSADQASSRKNDSEGKAALSSRQLSETEVRKEGEYFVWQNDPSVRVEARSFKMSKSRGNVVNPDEIIRNYGADSLRLYEMFMGPIEQVKPWSMKGVGGVYRFLGRVWRLMVDKNAHLHSEIVDVEPTREQLGVLHSTIQKVTADIERMRFNTAISAMMIFVDAALKWSVRPKSTMRTFILLLSPFAPHISEELWEKLGNHDSLAKEPWPQFDPEYLKKKTREIVVQVNGKRRASIMVPVDAGKDTILRAAREEANVVRHIGGKSLRREIYVPKKLVNFVI